MRTGPVTGSAVSPETARTCHRSLEPVHAMVYFAPEAQEEYAASGLDTAKNWPRQYFPARAAALGSVGPGLVQATFFNFSRAAVVAGMTGAWDDVSPEQLVAARFRAADRALRRLCGDLLDSPLLAEAVELARTAAAGCTPYGRPLYAANADLEWPESLPQQLFHAATLLREFRGDGHIVALASEGISGLEAAVTHVAQGDSWTRRPLQKTRGYTDEQWDAAVAGLVERGWLTPQATFTDAGRAARQRVEDLTDSLALPAWERLGDAGCARFRELVRPLSRAIVAADGIRIR